MSETKGEVLGPYNSSRGRYYLLVTKVIGGQRYYSYFESKWDAYTAAAEINEEVEEYKEGQIVYYHRSYWEIWEHIMVTSASVVLLAMPLAITCVIAVIVWRGFLSLEGWF